LKDCRAFGDSDQQCLNEFTWFVNMVSGGNVNFGCGAGSHTVSYASNEFINEYNEYMSQNAALGTDYLNYVIGKPWNQIHKGLRLGPLSTDMTSITLCTTDVPTSLLSQVAALAPKNKMLGAYAAFGMSMGALSLYIKGKQFTKNSGEFARV